MSTIKDADWMRRAISLARAQHGKTARNPPVGCVLVHNDLLIGEGATSSGGSPHAEENALASLSHAARGATAFVTLEPCGERSSSAALCCAQRLVQAGVQRVVVASMDTSRFASGRGLAQLRAAGVVVETGLLADEAAALYAAYLDRLEARGRLAGLRGIAFDLDQTLAPRDAAFWRWIDSECVASPGHTVDRLRVAELDRSGHGPKPPLLAYLAAALGWPESTVEARQQRFVAGTLRATVPDARVLAVLTRLRKSYRLAVITNGSSESQRGKLARLGLLEQLETVLVSEEVGSKKPEPAIFQRLLDDWQLRPHELAFVGDHPQKDVLGARAAGLLPIWVANGMAWPLPEAAPLQIESVLELEALLGA